MLYLITMNKQAFETAVYAKLAEANATFGTNICLTYIKYFQRGQCLGRAGHLNGSFYLKFNIEAIEKYWNDMVNDTIPHEIAHLVCFAKRSDNGHGRNWKAVCSRLGGRPASSCNGKQLTKARRTLRFEYIMPSGRVYWATSMKHKGMIIGGRAMTFNDTGERINGTYFTGRSKFE